MDETNIRTFKDFLSFYNLMSETCFNHCVDSFNSRSLDKNEDDCVEKCAHKLVRFNNRSIAVYANIQTDLMEKRQKELEAAEKARLNDINSNNLAVVTDSKIPVDVPSEVKVEDHVVS